MRLILLVTLLIASASSYGHRYDCIKNNLTRIIEVQHEPGSELPCSVSYQKPDEGETTTPWRAQNTPGYCREKADALAQRLEGFGWQCFKEAESGSE